MKVFAATYTHPECHGPHLSSVLALSLYATQITVLARNIIPTEWTYPTNVRLILSGEYVYITETEQKPTIWKSFSFLGFAFNMWKALRRDRYATVLLYDPIPLFAFALVRHFIGYKPMLWYHNYDIMEQDNKRRYTISWFAVACERAFFRKTGIFSLPSEDRKPFFPLASFKGKTFLIPNYPRHSLYGDTPHCQRTAPKEEARLIYCGTISPGHGLEEIILLLREPVAGKRLVLVLKGHITAEYKSELMRLADVVGAADNLQIIGRGPLAEVPGIINACDIGVAIYTGKDLMNRTLGAGASCKIFEYVAAGLPVLLEAGHCERCFKQYEWAVPTMVQKESISRQIEVILANYDTISRAALRDFDSTLNCDRYFKEVIDYVKATDK
jgi:hypothetical protein